MRILMVVIRGQTPGYGGAACQAISLCRELKKININSLILTGGTHKAEDVRIKPLCSNFSDTFRKMSFPIALFFYLIFNRKKFDVLHIHGAYWMSFGSVIAAKLLGKPIIIKLSMFGEDDPLTIVKEKFHLHGFGMFPYLSLKLATKIICISRELSEAYHQGPFSPKKLIEIPNGVDVNRFKPLQDKERNQLKKKLGFKSQEKIISFQGSVSLRKGIDILLEIWPKVFKKFPQTKLLFLGPVDKTIATKETFFDYAKNFMTKEVFQKSVILTGLISQDKIIEYFQVSDVFVLPSIKEGLPNSLLEAMSIGLPSIATAIGGINDLIIKGQNGFTFKKENDREFLNHLLTLIGSSDSAEGIGRAARQTIIKKYSMKRVALQYKSLYQEIIN